MSIIDFDPAMVAISAMALGVAAILLLTAFSSRLHPKVRNAVEILLVIGYPLAVAVCFGALSYRAYQEGNDTSMYGFAVGGAAMVFLAIRSQRRRQAGKNR